MTRSNVLMLPRLALFLAASLALTVGPIGAQTTNFGGFPESTLVSANVLAPPNSSKIVYTVPDDRVFILTTFCGLSVFGTNSGLSGSTLGQLPFATLGTADLCTNFSPGWAIPPGEVLTCSIGAVGEGGFPCGVSGILIKKNKRSRYK